MNEGNHNRQAWFLKHRFLSEYLQIRKAFLPAYAREPIVGVAVEIPDLLCCYCWSDAGCYNYYCCVDWGCCISALFAWLARLEFRSWSDSGNRCLILVASNFPSNSVGSSIFSEGDLQLEWSRLYRYRNPIREELPLFLSEYWLPKLLRSSVIGFFCCCSRLSFCLGSSFILRTRLAASFLRLRLFNCFCYCFFLDGLSCLNCGNCFFQPLLRCVQPLLE